MPGLNEAEVKVVNGIPRHPYTGNIAKATEQAIRSAKEKYNSDGKAAVLHYGNYGRRFDYTISSNAIEICFSPKHQAMSVNKGVHLALAEHLDEVINNSIEVEEHPDYIKDKDGKRGDNVNPNAIMHRFYGVAVIDGIPCRVMTLMRESGNEKGGANGIHSYEVQKIEVLDNEMPSTTNGVGTHQTELSAYPLVKLLKGIEKSYDKGKFLLDESEKSSESAKKEPYNPRMYITPVRGGWTKKKIIQRLKDMHGSRRGPLVAARMIAEFDSPQELADHMFYHGTVYGHGALKPSVLMSDRELGRVGGGGYGERYWGVSVSKDKRIASNFSGSSRYVDIYPIVLAKGAKVKEMPELEDASELDDHIVDLWTEGFQSVV